MRKLSDDRPICVAILAIGGQGGGVLTDWLVRLAEIAGWRVQATSVPGVAQRTGATIYYLEFIARSARSNDAVLSLMPVPGEVDLVVAAEWMEAGRAVQRGFVTPDRTTLIASTQRSYSVGEKSVPGDGLGDGAGVGHAAETMSKRLLTADMQKIANDHGSVISASLLGAIHASGVLPFERDAFEAAIRQAGVGVERSLAAFAAGHDAVLAEQAATQDAGPGRPDMVGGSEAQRAAFAGLVQRIESGFARPCHDMLHTGIRRLADFQDCAFAGSFLDRLELLHSLDIANGGEALDFELTTETARYLAAAMSYRDVIRVADLKTRKSRFDRVRVDAAAGEDQIVAMTEFLHPRLEEICGVLPVRLGRRVQASPFLGRLVTAMFGGGKRVRTDTLKGFLQLYVLAGLKGWRLRSLRHAEEMEQVDRWLEQVKSTVEDDYALAVEVARCRRLVKGYASTHDRSMTKYARVMDGIDQLRGRADAADWAGRLIKAALKDADGEALDGALKTIASFADAPEVTPASAERRKDSAFAHS